MHAHMMGASHEPGRSILRTHVTGARQLGTAQTCRLTSKQPIQDASSAAEALPGKIGRLTADAAAGDSSVKQQGEICRRTWGP